jgi:nicotinate-nucleotide adenylyltransferase
MKIGLFFGSFNPIHIGHLILADTMAQSTDCDQVWFVVSPHNPHKERSSLLHEFDRYDLVRLAISDNPRLDVTDIEFSLPRPSYTIDTLAHLSEKYPQHEFAIIMGEDNLTHFQKWKNHDKILKYYEILVYPRPAVAKTVWHTHEKVRLVEAPMIDISATFIRKRIKAHQSIRYLVTPEVETMIRLKKFYL